MEEIKEYLKQLTDEGIIHQDVKNNIIECVPDDTQYQIVRLMNLLNCNYALVLNMYDECNPNSTEILTNRSFKVELLSSDSIFNESRNDELKKHFNGLPSGVKEEFQLFTYNLMDDECFSKFKLLDAIQDFYKKNKEICDGASYNSWQIFDDTAFNFRPWQC